MNSYVKYLTIEEELLEYEDKIKQIKSYLDSINLEDLDDRIHWRATKTGQMPLLTASKEAQAASFMKMMESLPKLFNQLDELRNKYQEKQFLTRGDVKIKNTGMDFAKKFGNKD